MCNQIYAFCQLAFRVEFFRLQEMSSTLLSLIKHKVAMTLVRPFRKTTNYCHLLLMQMKLLLRTG